MGMKNLGRLAKPFAMLLAPAAAAAMGAAILPVLAVAGAVAVVGAVVATPDEEEPSEDKTTGNHS
jgi:hypothetical protein